MKIFFSVFFIALSAFAAGDCFDAYYDLGSDAAAIGLFCKQDSPEAADLVFCKRQPLLSNRYCTGSRDPISCRWQESYWLCEKGGEYPYTAKISRMGFEKIHFEFRSKFNSGIREGSEIH